MAYKDPPKEHQFKAGNRANPTGFNMSPDVRALRNLTKQQLVEIGNKIVQSTYEQLVEMSKDDKLLGIYRMIIGQVLKAVEQKDTQACDLLLNRLIGKVRDEILHQGDIIAPPQIILTLPDNGRSVKTIEAKAKELPPSDDDVDLGF